LAASQSKTIETPAVKRRRLKAALRQDREAANLTQAEATVRFERERVPFSMILSADDLTRDPHAVAIGLFVEDTHHVVGPTRVPRHPTRFRGTPAQLRNATPALGEHTDAVLASLGLADRVDDLRARGVVA